MARDIRGLNHALAALPIRKVMSASGFPGADASARICRTAAAGTRAARRAVVPRRMRGSVGELSAVRGDSLAVTALMTGECARRPGASPRGCPAEGAIRCASDVWPLKSAAGESIRYTCAVGARFGTKYEVGP